MFTITSHIQVDLRAIPFTGWPEEAKFSARGILAHRQKEYKKQLFKKDWLVAQVELEQKIMNEFLVDMSDVSTKKSRKLEDKVKEHKENRRKK